MSKTPPTPSEAEEFKPRSPWGRMPAQTFTLSPKLPALSPKPAARQQQAARPTSSILSGSALPVGPSYVPPKPARAPEPEPEVAPEPPPVAIWRPETPAAEPEMPVLEEVTIFAPTSKAKARRERTPWLVGGAVAAIAVAGAAAFMLRPQEQVVEEPALAPVAAAPAPVIEEPQLVGIEPEPVVESQAAPPAIRTEPLAPAQRAAPTPRPAPRRAVVQAEPPALAIPAPPQPATPAPTPSSRLESLTPAPVQPLPQPPVVRQPIDPNAPIDTNDNY